MCMGHLVLYTGKNYPTKTDRAIRISAETGWLGTMEQKTGVRCPNRVIILFPSMGHEADRVWSSPNPRERPHNNSVDAACEPDYSRAHLLGCFLSCHRQEHAGDTGDPLPAVYTSSCHHMPPCTTPFPPEAPTPHAHLTPSAARDLSTAPTTASICSMTGQSSPQHPGSVAFSVKGDCGIL
jgi:hypothetical protein